MKTIKLSLFTACITFGCLSFWGCTKNTSNAISKTSVIDDGLVNSATEASLKRNLVAWYTFNGDLLDHSGHGNNINFNSATPAAGKHGVENTAYYFDGSNYMTVPNSNSLNPSTGITIAVLFKPQGYYQGVCHSNRLLCKGYNDYWDGRYTIGYDDQPYYNYGGCNEQVQPDKQNPYGSYGNGQGTASGVTDTDDFIKAGSWYKVVYTYDGNYSKLYINGTLRSQAQVSTNFTANNRDLFIGRNEDPGYPFYFTGIIDEIRIYNKALTSDEVSDHSTH